jgi:Zn-dependent protease
MSPDFLVLAVLQYVVFLFSTTCHEAAHAFVAKLGGDLTAFHGGQVSLSPVPHIRREPFGMVLVPLLSLITGGGMIGWASAPYDPYWRLRHPRRAALMSLAGPAANFTLVLLAGISIVAGIKAGYFEMPSSFNSLRVTVPVNPSDGVADAIARALSIFFSLNLLLGCFNLIPVPPLDGFGALSLVAGDKGAQALAQIERQIAPFAFVGLLVAYNFFGGYFRQIFLSALAMIYPTAFR